MTFQTPLPRLRLVAPGGPVTRALASLREAERLPETILPFAADDGPASIPNLRRAIRRQLTADMARVERLIGCLDLLDRMEGDEDAEDGGGDEAVNEDGGDIQDEPHDAEEDMGASEDEGVHAGVVFDGANYHKPRLALGPDGLPFREARA